MGRERFGPWVVDRLNLDWHKGRSRKSKTQRRKQNQKKKKGTASAELFEGLRVVPALEPRQSEDKSRANGP